MENAINIVYVFAVIVVIRANEIYITFVINSLSSFHSLNYFELEIKKKLKIFDIYDVKLAKILKMPSF